MLIAFAWLLKAPRVVAGATQNVVRRARRQRQHGDRMTGNRNMSKMDAARSALTQVLSKPADDANVGLC